MRKRTGNSQVLRLKPDFLGFTQQHLQDEIFGTLPMEERMKKAIWR